MNWYLGTVGFGYKQWLGNFYPGGLQSHRFLAHYAQTFNSVEIDSTFYGTPDGARVTRWAAAVPDDFRFAVKTPRQITHDHRLLGVEAEMVHFVTTMQQLGHKLGPILIQLPPDFTVKEVDSLALFLANLPPDLRYAVEFRHRSWDQTDETATMLAALNICQVSTDYVIMPKKVHTTTDFTYIRFLGRHGRYETKHKEMRDPTNDLKWWVKEIKEAVAKPAAHTIFGYFNNDFAGYSPESCHKFKRLLGLDSELPQIAIQGSLF